jgi:hypothetical protein
MAKALEEQRRQPDVAALAFEERLGLLVDRESIERENKRLVSRLRFAGLRQNAAIEDIDTRTPRGLDKALFAKLAAGDWITRHENLIIVGKTGLGKVGWPVRSATRPAAMIAPSSTTAYRGASLPEVQTTLGHGNIATTSGYLHARPDTSSGLHLDPGVFLR